jgi:ribosomal protein S18 acetylase RimI-like enzyme
MIHITNRNDKTFITGLLVKAFDTNISVNKAVKQDRKRVTRIRRLMEYSFEMCLINGEIYMSQDKNAVVLFLNRRHSKTTLDTLWLDMKLALGAIGINRAAKVLKKEKTIKKLYPDHDFMYLWYIGVNPEHQGKGAGSALMQEITAMADKRTQDIYLETSIKNNLPFYARCGFQIYTELLFDFRLYCLRRACMK